MRGSLLPPKESPRRVTLLNMPTLLKELFLYVIASKEVMSDILICQLEKKQILVYYHSKMLQRAKVHYPHIENIAYAIFHTACRFKTYFLLIPSRF